MGIIIRRWQKSDLESIRRITWQSWISTYSSFIPESDLKSYFETHYSEASLLSMFNDPSMQGFVAEMDNHIAGYSRLFFRKVGFLFIREEPFTMGKTTVSHLIGYKKSGRGTLLNQKTYTTFDGGESLSGLCLEFLSG